jgi:amino-acid N-acetyltransferase
MTTLIATKLDAASIDDMAHFLAAAGLPTSDLTEPGRTFYRFDATTVVGYGGLEGLGVDRLLRSLVVLHDRRGLGIGKRMVFALEDEARAQGALRLHLLTNTAAPFFRACGYVDADRATAPASIAASAEFTTLCPASAAYLVKPLETFV